MRYIGKYESPLGKMLMTSDGEKLTGLWFEGGKIFEDASEDALERDLPVFDRVREWLDVYFSGREPDFTPPLSLEKATPFRRRVWELLKTIGYSQTVSYKELAVRLEKQSGKKVAAQAVGGAVGHNPIAIVIPCHRVIGANGDPTGYAGGLDKKIALLNIEDKK